MKCEIKYIKSKVNKDCKKITIKGVLLVVLISFTVSFILSIFLENSAIYFLVLLLFIAVLYAVWKDAVDYCKTMNTNIQ